MSTTNDTSESSDNVHTTPTSVTTLSPTWAPPKAPLPPHRLAKLANALGVSTPVPIHHRPRDQDRFDRSGSPYNRAPSPAFSTHSLNTPDAYASIRDAYSSLRRSPTPSSAGSVMNGGTPYTFTSKFLIHVIPPLFLPHDDQLMDNVPSGSGYHSQFRRGTLVPVHPTLQAQLWAIAKEYALPSTTGLVLYLVTTPQTPQNQSTPTGVEIEDDHDEPGPRLSEDVWRHLWTRVWKAEREELPPGLSALGVAGPLMSPGMPYAGRSTPQLLNDSVLPSSPLRPFLSNGNAPGIESAFSQANSYPSPSASTPSTPAFSGSVESRSPTAEGPQDTPPTSHSNSLDSTDADPSFLRANSLPLPGLNSPSLMPILAKVEFDIDRRKAGWYEPWAKRRRAKKKGKKSKAGEVAEETSQPQPPKRLKLSGRAQTASPVSLFSLKDQQGSEAQYERLSEEESEEEEDDDDIGDEDETARVMSTSGPDPLEDVFGTDADTWADLKGSRPRTRTKHDLALTGEELAELEDAEDDELFDEEGGEHSELTRGAEEISEIMAQMGGERPQLAVDTSIDGVVRRHVPPPLVLHPVGGAKSTELTVPSPLGSANSLKGQGSGSSSATSLPYLKGTALDGVQYEDDPDASDHSEAVDEDEEEEEVHKLRSPADSEKRTGGVYDDLDLDLGEFDDNDPNDRRKSQIILRAKLDEIERNLAQLSPRALKIDLEDEQVSANLSSPGSPFLGIPSSASSTPVLMNSDVLPPTPRKGNFSDGSPRGQSRDSSASSSASPPRPAWPAVPFSALSEEDKDGADISRRSRTDSVSSAAPRLAVNGVSTFAPTAFKRQGSDSRGSNGDISAETLQRRKEAEEEESLYPALHPRTSITGSDSSSPIIPLSPDPFGRFSSTPEPPEIHRQSVRYWDAVPVGGGSADALIKNSRQRQASVSSVQREAIPRTSEASSRFSADSTKDNIEVPPSIAKSLSGSSAGSAGGKDSVKDKSGSRSTVISMKGIKKLWRKSNKSSVSISGAPSELSPIPPSPTVESTSLNTPSTPNFPSTSRSPSPQSLQNLTAVTTAPTRPSRPSKEELYIPDIPEQMAIPLHPANGRPAPMPIIAAQMQAGLHSRPPGVDRMQFDQESPYPMPSRRQPARKMSTSMTSPPMNGSTARAPSPAHSMGNGSAGQASGAAASDSSRQANVRKSILKWKAAAAAQQNGEQADNAPSRPSAERTSSSSTVGPRSHRMSGSSRVSVSGMDIPPSPKIPEHFLSSRPAEHLRTGSHLTNSSTDSRLTTVTDVSSFQSLGSPPSSQTSHGSPPSKLKHDLSDPARKSSLDSNTKFSMDRKRSYDSERLTTDDDDGDSRPSIDSSQFEMVSPKMTMNSLSYPYTTVGMNNDS